MYYVLCRFNGSSQIQEGICEEQNFATYKQLTYGFSCLSQILNTYLTDGCSRFIYCCISDSWKEQNFAI